jgi:long-subunit acyl-CoA synthetase (AMP-forming)
MRGYWGREDKMRDTVTEEGWLKTGWADSHQQIP